ncbi:MAG: aminotransferase class I/II-fold pyridoxal phosphate-dependent enzyme [Acidobacteriota bacterium]
MNESAHRRLNPALALFEPSVIRSMTLRADTIPGSINLSQGFPDSRFATPDFVKQAAVQAIMDGVNQYAPPQGVVRLREAVAAHAKDWLGFEPDPLREVVITCGATEAMYSAVQALTQPGDTILIPSPSYENYGAVCKMLQLTPRYVRLQPPEWRIDLDALERQWQTPPHPKVLLLCNPNNPTGTVYSHDELTAIAALCKKYDGIVITDEVYEHMVFDGQTHCSMAAIDGMRERTVTISSVSKTFSVTGWRIGTVIAPARLASTIVPLISPGGPPTRLDLATAICQVHDYMTISAPHPLQMAIARAYEVAATSDYYARFTDDYRQRREYLYSALIDAGFKTRRPAGGYYFMVDVSEYGLSDVQFAEKLIDEIGLVSVPASCFFLDKSDPSSRNYIRLCCCKSDALLAEAVNRLQRWRNAA